MRPTHTPGYWDKGHDVHKLSGSYVGELHKGRLVDKLMGNYGNIGNPGNPDPRPPGK